MSKKSNYDTENESGTQVLTRPETKTKTPSFYKVLLLNDDFTPMEFVIEVLQRFFRKNTADSEKIMLQVHHDGSGVAGVYTYEIAETKAFQVHEYAKQNEHPLKCTIEKE